MLAEGCQKALVQIPVDIAASGGWQTLPLAASDTVQIPLPTKPNHVLVRVLAVALNPTDHKIITHFPQPGGLAGCDFCGIVAETGPATAVARSFPPGTRVCGAVFPYGRGPDDTHGEDRSGSFAEWLVADAHVLLRVPAAWSDLEAAALGGVGWGTVGLAMADPEALHLSGSPSQPAGDDAAGVGDEDREPVLVYGGGTATGTMACQLLALSGYRPIAITSVQSTALAIKYGAEAVAHYTSPTCAQDVRTRLTSPRRPIRHVLDCITSPTSAAICLAAMARTGGYYACLEAMPAAWRTRRAVRVKEVAGYEGLGQRVRLGVLPADEAAKEPRHNTNTTKTGLDTELSADASYDREANLELLAVTRRWTGEVQALLDKGMLKHHPVQEVHVEGDWAKNIIHGLGELQKGHLRGHKLVVRIHSE